MLTWIYIIGATNLSFLEALKRLTITTSHWQRKEYFFRELASDIDAVDRSFRCANDSCSVIHQAVNIASLLSPSEFSSIAERDFVLLIIENYCGHIFLNIILLVMKSKIQRLSLHSHTVGTVFWVKILTGRLKFYQSHFNWIYINN